MPVRVKLSEVMAAFDEAGFEVAHYLDLETGKTIRVTEDMDADWGDDEDDEGEAQAVIDDETGRYKKLPDRFETQTWKILEGFVRKKEDAKQAAVLSAAIQGRGAFRRFKDACSRMGLLEKWYAHERQTHKEWAIEWCEAEGIEFEDDVVVK